jgi:hypothetical protein
MIDRSLTNHKNYKQIIHRFSAKQPLRCAYIMKRINRVRCASCLYNSCICSSTSLEYGVSIMIVDAILIPQIYWFYTLVVQFILCTFLNWMLIILTFPLYFKYSQ